MPNNDAQPTVNNEFVVTDNVFCRSFLKNVRQGRRTGLLVKTRGRLSRVGKIGMPFRHATIVARDGRRVIAAGATSAMPAEWSAAMQRG